MDVKCIFVLFHTGVYEHIRHKPRDPADPAADPDSARTPYFDMGRNATVVHRSAAFRNYCLELHASECPIAHSFYYKTHFSFVGQTTHLHCVVRDIGDRRVSAWI